MRDSIVLDSAFVDHSDSDLEHLLHTRFCVEVLPHGQCAVHLVRILPFEILDVPYSEEIHPQAAFLAYRGDLSESCDDLFLFIHVQYKQMHHNKNIVAVSLCTW